ncbi:DUF1471 domain-containing protein [Pantoea allii]|uniref:DUF1471 domain-containing protein n=1 Tax=Pantoea allii TaxID=574096 RepID=UPI003D7B4323
MKHLPAYLTAAALLATASFPTFAATAVDQREAQNLQKIGSVSVSSVNGSLDDVTRQLSQQAKAEGARHFRVIGVDTPGDSSFWTGTAEIYR